MKINYKVWDKAKKKMYHFGKDIAYITHTGTVALMNGGFIMPSNAETLMYSGLQDDYKKEICEGDIVDAIYILGSDWMLLKTLESGDFYRGVVVFEKGAFCLKIKSNPEHPSLGFRQFDIDTAPEVHQFVWKRVLGNVYEHTEMI
jgi:hypothetical protein